LPCPDCIASQTEVFDNEPDAECRDLAAKAANLIYSVVKEMQPTPVDDGDA